MNLDEVLNLLLCVADDTDRVFDVFDVQQWPSGCLEMLCGLGILREASGGHLASCPDCNGGHRERIEYSHSATGEDRMHIWCPESMRVAVTAEMCQGWEINPAGLARAIARSAGLEGDVHAIADNEYFYCGYLSHNDVHFNVFYSCGNSTSQGHLHSETIPISVAPPIVLMPSKQAVCEALDNMNPIVIPIKAVLAMTSDELVFEHRIIRQAMKSYFHSQQLAEFIFARRGDFWDVRFQGGNTKHIKDSKGMQYLARLLAEPHKDILAVTLLASVAGIDELILTGSSGESIDLQAKEGLRQRYKELMGQVELAQKLNDLGMKSMAQDEIDVLVVEMNKRIGIKGKIREASDPDRVRSSVSMAVSRARDQVRRTIPELGIHLDRSVSAGLYFKYSPDREIDWDL